MSKVSLGTIIFIIFCILVVGWLVTNNVYTFYEKNILKLPYYRCEDGEIIKEEIKNDFGGYISMFVQPPEHKCELNCLSNYKHRSYFYCNEDEEIECVCEITFYDKYITPLF